MSKSALPVKGGRTGVRRALHVQLVPEAWPSVGLSPVNRLVCAAILIGTILAVHETEPEVVNAAPAGLIEVVELGFGLLFAAEYIARVFAAGEEPRYRGIFGRMRYMATPLAIIDLIAIAPLFVVYGTTDTMMLRMLRLLRILRLARLGRLSVAFNHLATAVRGRRYELGLSAGLAAVILLFSSTLMYVFESASQPEAFGSVPRALWWSIATLTTVGYGDVYPVTPAGKVLAGITAISAIGLIAMPTGILAAAFSDALQRHREARQPKHAGPADADRQSRSGRGG